MRRCFALWSIGAVRSVRARPTPWWSSDRRFDAGPDVTQLLWDVRRSTLTAPNRCPPSLLRAVYTTYMRLDSDAAKTDFFADLVGILGVRHEDVAAARESLDAVGFAGQTSAALRHLADVATLRKAVTPLYEEIFAGLAREVDNGPSFVVQLRGDVLRLRRALEASGDEDQSRQRRALQDLDEGLRDLLGTWFSVGNLDLRRLTYESASGAVLEQIARREAVHPVRTLSELKARLGPGRRCFAFFHGAMATDPLAFVHVALVPDVARSMAYIREATGRPELESRARCAIFYSITSAQPGLSGVEMGNMLLKRVVRILSAELPDLTTFVTLSPIPGFRSFLRHAAHKEDDAFELLTDAEEELLRGLETKGPEDGKHGSLRGAALLEAVLGQEEDGGPRGWDHVDDGFVAVVQPILRRLALRYLVEEKRDGGLRALDPVANFHLRNGALVEGLNWAADPSSKGWQRSYGMMVNYLYRLEGIEERSHDYSLYGTIVSEVH